MILPHGTRSSVIAFAAVCLASGSSYAQVGTSEPDTELLQHAITIVTSSDSVERQIAMLQVHHPELFAELARNDKDLDVRRTAVLLLSDQEELKHHAVDPHAVIREAAVAGMDDESFLLARVHARDEPSPTVRYAIVQSLRSQEAIAQAAQTAYYRDVRAEAAKRVTDEVLSARVKARQAAITALVKETKQADASSKLAEVALHGDYDVVCQAAATGLERQEDLAAVALSADDRDVLKIVLGKLTDATLLNRVAAEAKDVPMRLAAACKADSRTWASVFSDAAQAGKNSTALGDALAAVSLYTEVQESAKYAVQQACLSMIREGDESRIPEMSDLLMLYGDKRLGEDYLNCGQPDLDNAGRRWARAHGYNVGRGYGSHRASWGSGR